MMWRLPVVPLPLWLSRRLPAWWQQRRMTRYIERLMNGDETPNAVRRRTR